MRIREFFSKKPDSSQVLKQGRAMRVVFFYPGEEGTYIDHVNVTLLTNGIVLIESQWETTTTHIQNCEILWRFETGVEDGQSSGQNKVRLLRDVAAKKNPPQEPTP